MAKKIFTAVVLSVLLAVVVLPYLWVEVNTLAFKDEFKDLYLQTYEAKGDYYCINKDNYCKVFYKLGDKAKVFYATDTSTFLCYFLKDSSNNTWEIYDADVLWSKSGSASDFSFPFYPVKDLRSYLA